jgi:signal transduction histidine kinase
MPRDKLDKLLKVVFNSANHLSHVIEDALDVSRIENNKFELVKEVFNLREAIQEVADTMRFQIEQKGLVMELHYSDEVPEKAKSDSKRIKQVLFNLIGNATKFTYEGAISIYIGFERLTHSLRVSVRDSGIGISADDLKKLFRFFGQATHSKNINRSGMGLGLTISKLIV